jgi:hypothetical protein
MKHVFSNSGEVAHIWAQNEAGRNGRNGTNNASFDASNGRQTFYSYREPIAWFLTDQIVVLNSQRYSSTTSGHQQDVLRAVTHKTFLQIDGARPSDSPEDLAAKCIAQAMGIIAPIADRSVRAVHKVKWEMAKFHVLIGYLGALSGVEQGKYYKPIMAMVRRLNDSELTTALELLEDWVRNGGRAQVSKEQAGVLAQVIVGYYQWVDADNATQRYLDVMKHAREHFKEDKVGSVLYLERYVVGCNRQLLYKLTKAQVKRITTLYTTLRAEAAQDVPKLLDVNNETRSDWRHGEYVLKTFQSALDPQVYEDLCAKVKRSKYDQLSGELKGIKADGLRFGLHHGIHMLDRWREAADGDQVLLTMAAKVMGSFEAQEQERQAKLLAENAAFILAWRAKDDVHTSESRVSLYDLPPMLRLRAKGRAIETSRGARVPSAVAETLWPLVQECRRSNVGMSPDLVVGNYRLNAVLPDGSLIIGCHTLPYAELALMAQQLNLKSDSQGETA